jgi:drug/metabolite transporter (DMT)-like permease
VLASSSEATSIVSGVLLSIFWLGDKFYPKYDAPALLLIIFGGLGILCLATVPIPDYTFERLTELVFSTKSILFLSLVGLLFVLSGVSFYCMMRDLQKFE